MLCTTAIKYEGNPQPYACGSSIPPADTLPNLVPPWQVAKYDDPQEAAIALVVESYHLWLQYETRTDDISACVIMVEGLEEAAGATTFLQCVLSLFCTSLPGPVVCAVHHRWFAQGQLMHSAY